MMQIYSKNGFLSYAEKHDLESIKTGFAKIDGSKVFSGEVIGIGG